VKDFTKQSKQATLAAMMPRLLVTSLGASLSVGCGWLTPPNQLASAARAGDLDTIDRLVAAGADVNAPSGVNGWPPILHALHKGQHASVERLLEKGASLQGRAGRDVVRWVSGYGAAEWRGCEAHTRLLRLVLARDPVLKDGADEAKSFARRKGCSEILQMLGDAPVARAISPW
jgi:ankyrin repeat protein